MKRLYLFLCIAVILFQAMEVVVFADTVSTSSILVRRDADYNYAEQEPDSVPHLIIRATDSTVIEPGLKFRLRLTNASWSYSEINSKWDDYIVKTGAETYEPGSNFTGRPNFTIEIFSEKDAYVTVNDKISADESFKYISIPLITKLENGAASVEVKDPSGVINDATVDFTYYSSLGVFFKIKESVEFDDAGTMKPLRVDEVIPGSLNRDKGNTLTLSLPTGFEWLKAGTDNIVEIKSSDWEGSVKPSLVRSSFGTTSQGEVDKSKLILELNDFDANLYKRGYIQISNLQLKSDSDIARPGSVLVKFKGLGLDGLALYMAKYVPTAYSLSFAPSSATPPTLVSGRYPKDPEDESIKALKVTLKEDQLKSWMGYRNLKFTFPEGVKPRAVEVKTEKFAYKNLIDYLIVNEGSNGTTITDKDVPALNNTWILNDDGLTIYNPVTGRADKGIINLTFYLSIDPEFSGDITCTAGGDALDKDISVVIAKAVPAVTINPISIAYDLNSKSVPTPDIEITENVAGGIITEKEFYQHGFKTVNDGLNDEALIIGLSDFDFSGDIKAEVIEGDLVLDTVALADSDVNSPFDGRKVLKIYAKQKSTVPSKIRITGTEISVNRMYPYGSYPLLISGFICANYSDEIRNGGALFNNSYINSIDDFVILTTPMQDNSEDNVKNVVLKIGSSTMAVADESVKLDAAPFIYKNISFIPLSAVSKALGLEEKDIQWNPLDKSITISIDNKVFRMDIGKDILIVNGSDLKMSSPPIIKNNRAFVPFRVLGEQVLGAKVDWNPQERTITITKEVKSS